MEKEKEELKKIRMRALVFAGVAVAFSIFMWIVTPSSMLGTNIGCSIVMAFPVAGLLWVAQSADMDLARLDSHNMEG